MAAKRTEEQKQRYREAAARRVFRNNRPPGTYKCSEATKQKMRESNLKTWQQLPTKWLESCLLNDEWFEKLRDAAKLKPAKTTEHLHKIVEAKVGMPYDTWLVVRGEYAAYDARVRTITERQELSSLSNWEKRGKGYHLDHRFSIIEGFRNGVDPEIIGDITNLEFVPVKVNLTKNSKCSITLQELLLRYNGRTRQQS
jgi:hypothetical protein